jgi:hypothetical protein
MQLAACFHMPNGTVHYQVPSFDHRLPVVICDIIVRKLPGGVEDDGTHLNSIAVNRSSNVNTELQVEA